MTLYYLQHGIAANAEKNASSLVLQFCLYAFRCIMTRKNKKLSWCWQTCAMHL